MDQHYQGLAHVAVYTQDMEESIAFYERIGGRLSQRAAACPPEQRSDLALVSFGGFVVGLIQGAPPSEKGALPHFAVNVDDVDAPAADLRAAGVDTFLTPEKVRMPHTFGGLENWFFTGPSGEQIELLHML